MEGEVNIQEMLKSVGLTEYETKAYVSLLQYGNCTAEKLSQISGIPLPRIYDTITELHNKGFVLISKTRPKIFRPVPSEKALNHFVNIRKKEMDSRLESLKEKASKAVGILSGMQKISMPDERSSLWSVEKRRNMIKMLQDQTSLAKKGIMVFSGDMSWIDDILQSMRSAIRRKVKIRIVVFDPKGSKLIKENMKKARDIGVKILTGYKGLLRGYIIDNKVAYIYTKYSPGGGVNILEEGRPGTDKTRKYELLIIDNPTLVSAFSEYFELKWKELSKKH